jgi:hypothetical protein
MVNFQTKIPMWGKKFQGLDWKILKYFMAIRDILRPFWIFYDHWVHFVFIRYTFRFWYHALSKIWQPCPDPLRPNFISSPIPKTLRLRTRVCQRFYGLKNAALWTRLKWSTLQETVLESVEFDLLEDKLVKLSPSLEILNLGSRTRHLYVLGILLLICIGIFEN